MFNEKRIQDIRKKIQASTLLDDHEKADWLNLLSLMNDKQLGELEEILAAEKSVTPSMPVSAPSATTSTPQPQQKLPPLSHIANVPTDVNMPQPTPLSSVPKPTKPITIATPKPQQPAKPITPKIPFALQHAEELQNLSVEILRKFDEQSIISVIKSQIEQHGYFVVLQLIEASPLYEAYISSGQAQLKGEVTATAANPNRLSQTEFEFMTDLLSNMRFNRL